MMPFPKEPRHSQGICSIPSFLQFLQIDQRLQTEKPTLPLLDESRVGEGGGGGKVEFTCFGLLGLLVKDMEAQHAQLNNKGLI